MDNTATLRLHALPCDSWPKLKQKYMRVKRLNWLPHKVQSKLQALTKLRLTKRCDSSAFQAFVCQAEGIYRLIKTNLLVPEGTASYHMNEVLS